MKREVGQFHCHHRDSDIVPVLLLNLVPDFEGLVLGLEGSRFLSFVSQLEVVTIHTLVQHRRVEKESHQAVLVHAGRVVV